ncbi:MAG: hypothetical protein ABIY50_01735, partial [Ignavibacteria bacterium]
MKIFNFKINNFYSIFSPMQDDSKNMESYLDENIRASLKARVSGDFTFELMKRIELEKEFALEDVKTEKMARYIIFSLISLMTVFAFIIGLVLKTNEDGKEVSYLNSLINKFSTFIETISIIAAETFGFAFNFETGVIILIIMACIFLFSFAEK